MKGIVALVLGGILAATVLAACAVPSSGEGSGLPSQAPIVEQTATLRPSSVTATQAEPQRTESAAADPTRSGTEAYIERATLILAAELDITPAQVVVKGIEPVDWPDTALGCPQPSIQYASKVTPGYRVMLSAGSEDYAVHMAQDGTAVVCLADGTPIPGVIPIQPGERILDGQPWMPVD